METIITYDISGKQSEFKIEMKKIGYQDKVSGVQCNWINLPDTTLYHSNRHPQAANIDAQNICEKLSVRLERCFSTTWDRSSWWAMCGDPR